MSWVQAAIPIGLMGTLAAIFCGMSIHQKLRQRKYNRQFELPTQRQPRHSSTANAHGRSFHNRRSQNPFHFHFRRPGVHTNCRSCHNSRPASAAAGNPSVVDISPMGAATPSTVTATVSELAPIERMETSPETRLEAIAHLQAVYSDQSQQRRVFRRNVHPDQDPSGSPQHPNSNPDMLEPYPDLIEPPPLALNPSNTERWNRALRRREDSPAAPRTVRTAPHRSMITGALEFGTIAINRIAPRTQLGANNSYNATNNSSSSSSSVGIILTPAVFAPELDSLSADIQRLEEEIINTMDEMDRTAAGQETRVSTVLPSNPREEAEVVTMELTEVVTTQNHYARSGRIDGPGDAEGERDPPPRYEQAVAESGVEGYSHVG